MNLIRLIEEVGALGFENEVVADTPFLRFANRALYTVFTERGEVKRASIIAMAKIPALHIPNLIHTGGKVCKIDTVGRSYSFKVCGKGNFTVCDESGEKTVFFDTPYGIFRGLLSGKSFICFEGEYSYTVKDLACYDKLYGSENADIPVFSREVAYLIRDYAPDFLTLCENPTDSNGNAVTEARINGDQLILPYTFNGEIILPYIRAPKEISADNPYAEIDIPSDCLPLFPLLVAAYLWLDDDADKAQYYMSLYRDGMDRLIRKHPTEISPGYSDVLRWC